MPKPIQEKARNAYDLWSNNPRHPSLRFKKVHIKLPIYSVRIDIDWRAVGILDGDEEFKFAPVRPGSSKYVFYRTTKTTDAAQRLCMNSDCSAGLNRHNAQVA
ncbi:MAG: hypothetical protein M3Q00_13115 [Pseudomonadota bacterium]|nr:hypothetical protein [Pseudomonadota bacterium]